MKWAVIGFGLSVALAVAGGSPAAAHTAEEIFDDGSLHDVWITIDPGDWATLRRNYLEDTYYSASFTWNGVTSTAGVRSRGHGTRSAEKPNLTVNFRRYDKNQRFLGLRGLVLRANNSDASMIRERITMKMFHRVGLPASRVAPARVFINNEFFGLYCLVEPIDQEFLERTFGESDGYLYEWEPSFAYHFGDLGTDPAAYSPVLWQPETHEDDPDPAPIVELVQAVNHSSDAEFVAAVSPYLDLKLFAAQAAVENFMADFDGILSSVFGMNNFYFYRFQELKLSQFIPWDKDNSFDYFGYSILEGIDQNVLARRAMAVPAVRAAYLNTLVKCIDLAGGPDGWMAAEVEREYQQIAEVARTEPHKQCSPVGSIVTPCGAAEFEASIQHVREFTAKRAPFVLGEVAVTGRELNPAAPQVLTVGPLNSTGMNAKLARGSLMMIHGTNLGGGPTQTAEPPLPRQLGATLVVLNGARVPLLSLSPTTAIAQVPWDTDPGEVHIAVAVNGALSNTTTTVATDYAPTIIAAFHASFTPVNEANPAVGGETLVLYASGLGPVNAPVKSGLRAPSDVPVVTLTTPDVVVDGAGSEVTFSGLAPGLVGLYQVNVRLPAETHVGPRVTLQLSIGGQIATASIPVR